MDLAQFKLKLSTEGLAAWKFSTPVEYFWSFEICASQEQVWSILADTSRLNREMGFGPRQQKELDGRLMVTTKMIGLEQVWIEEPWLWQYGSTMISTRVYQRGLAEKMYSIFHMVDGQKPETKTVYVYFGWQPKNAFWSWFLNATGSLLQKKFAQAFAKIENEFKTSTIFKFEAIPPKEMSGAGLEKLTIFKEQLLEKSLEESVVRSLLHAVEKSDDLDLEPMRVLALAKAWSADERELLKTCLYATRFGLLKLSWDVICPHCRGSRFSASSLGDIPVAAKCEICDIDFTTSEENSIEVMFHIHPNVRKVEALSYCAAEPAKKSHIQIQGLATANSNLKLLMRLRPGRYRARVQGRSEVWEIEIDSSSLERVVTLTADGLKFHAGPEFELRFHNFAANDVLLVVEEVRWDPNILTPAQVLGIPEFRDLFSEEHLSSNVKLYLGEQVILFTDIVGSTQFYQRVGDAKAFSEVRAHFQEVFKLVDGNRGAVVKTIGDSVMASFLSIKEAVSAAIAIQERFSSDREDSDIRLRISVHSGPVIAVHLNTGLDFFGTTVNQAAKNQMMAAASEIACSGEVYERYLKAHPSAYPLEIRKNVRESSSPNTVYVLRIESQAVHSKTA